MPDEEEERTQNTDKEFLSEVDLALALALVQSMPWHAPSLDRPSASNSNEADTEASAPPMSSQQAQALQRAQLGCPRVAGRNPTAASTSDDTSQEDYDLWNPPQCQAKLTCNCLPGKQQMYLTADYNRTLAEHTWTQVTHYELVCVLFDGNQAASSSSACMAHHLCNCASDLTAQRSAVLLHSIEQCCHLLHWHVMSQEIPPIQALVSYRF
jgi:hypothetical protein